MTASQHPETAGTLLRRVRLPVSDRGMERTHTPLTDLRPVMPRIALKPASLLRLRDASSCLCPAHDLADERKRPLGGVAVQRRRVPIVSPSDSTGQGSGQSL